MICNGMGFHRKNVRFGLVVRTSKLATAAQEAMIDRQRHGLSFVRTRAMVDDDDESKRMIFSPLLAVP